MSSKKEGTTRLADHPFYGLMCAGAYGVVSITITLFNKAVFNYYEFKFPLTLFVAQMIFSLIFVSILKFGFPQQYDFPSPNIAMARKLWPMAMGWWVYGVSGVIALKYLNVPMFSAFRRFTTIIVMIGEYRLYGRRPPADQRNAVIVMSAGAAIAGLTDITFSLPGYCWVITCAVSTALYLLFISKLGAESGLNDLGLLFYNNLLALPFMAASLFFSGELPLVVSYKYLHTLDFQIFFLVSAMQAFFLNFLIFLCTRVNSPLTTSITGTIKDLVTNLLGMTLFGDFPFNPLNVLSIAVCFLGSVWYSKLKYEQTQKKKLASTDDRAPELEERKQLLAMEEGGEEYKAKEELVNLARQQQQQHKAAVTNVYMSDGLGGEKGGGVGSGAAGAAGGGLGRPGVPQATNELLEKKRALERQLRELEEQLGGGARELQPQ